ncbi:MAG TPA: methyltransferase domain-containing protein [Rhizomicrobium sp.]|nr:methyltransferase domain-containing protein [Rhizomicrobium sp.]
MPDPIAEADGLIADGRAREAAALLKNLIEAGRGGLLARLRLARALDAAGDNGAALAVARETALLHPNISLVAAALGEALLGGGRLPTAIGEFQRALRLDPDNAEARLGLGRAWLDAGEPEKALEAFDAIADEDARVWAAPKIAEAHAMRAAPRSNARYVRHLFDQFSTDYDARMIGQLGYRAPAILRELFDLTIAADGLSILDLGCGTGLSGEAFRDAAARLDGIDLSPAMIAKARARGIYDDLRVADLETTLDGARAYDLILAADTLVYFGDLAAVFKGAVRSLAPGGNFLFTVEKADGDGFELGPKRRWRHSQAYLRAQAGHAGFEISGFVDCVPRSEAGVPVEGYAVALAKPDRFAKSAE